MSKFIVPPSPSFSKSNIREILKDSGAREFAFPEGIGGVSAGQMIIDDSMFYLSKKDRARIKKAQVKSRKRIKRHDFSLTKTKATVVFPFTISKTEVKFYLV